MILKDISYHHTINRDTNFFHVGGNSLLLVNFKAKIQKEFGVLIKLVQLFESSRLASMAARIEKNAERGKIIQIDWETETAPDFENLSGSYVADSPVTRPGVVVLTGATGFLGRFLIKHLLEDQPIEKIHCISVRTARHREQYFVKNKKKKGCFTTGT